MRRLTESTLLRIWRLCASKPPLKVERAGLAAVFGVEKLEARQMLANIVWDGGPAGTGTDFNLAANWIGDVLPTAADTATINTAGPTITVGATTEVNSFNSSRSIRVNSGTFTTSGVNALSASVTLGGGTISGGTWNFSGTGIGMIGTSGGGTLASVTISGDVLLNSGSASLTLSGSTTFSAARLSAASVNLQM